MSTLTLETLVQEGRNLLSAHDNLTADRAFHAWDRLVAGYLDNHFPGTGLSAEWSSLPSAIFVEGTYMSGDPTIWLKFHSSVKNRLQWLSRIPTRQNFASAATKAAAKKAIALGTRKVFVVHGHNETFRESVSNTLRKLNLEPVILHEQPNAGKTVIEKFESNADVAFAVVLLTADDFGRSKLGGTDEAPRARQNVIFELGYFIGALGRDKVCSLYEEGVELPSDFAGVVYVPLDAAGNWKFTMAREIRSTGIAVDLNSL